MSVAGVLGEANPGKGLRRHSQTIEELGDKAPQRSSDHCSDTSHMYRVTEEGELVYGVKIKIFFLHCLSIIFVVSDGSLLFSDAKHNPTDSPSTLFRKSRSLSSPSDGVHGAGDYV